MKIGIDIDDTITDTYLNVLEFVSENKGISLDELKNRSYAYEDLYKGVEYAPMIDFIFSNFYKLIPILKPKKNAVEIINKLAEEGHEIIIITARNHAKENQNKEYLDSINIPYTKLYERINDKAEVARNEKIDVFIDDSINNCMKVQEEGVKVFLFDAPYNKNCTDLTRVCSWDEVYNEISKLANK